MAKRKVKVNTEWHIDRSGTRTQQYIFAEKRAEGGSQERRRQKRRSPDDYMTADELQEYRVEHEVQPCKLVFIGAEGESQEFFDRCESGRPFLDSKTAIEFAARLIRKLKWAREGAFHIAPHDRRVGEEQRGIGGYHRGRRYSDRIDWLAPEGGDE